MVERKKRKSAAKGKLGSEDGPRVQGMAGDGQSQAVVRGCCIGGDLLGIQPMTTDNRVVKKPSQGRKDQRELLWKSKEKEQGKYAKILQLCKISDASGFSAGFVWVYGRWKAGVCLGLGSRSSSSWGQAVGEAGCRYRCAVLRSLADRLAEHA